MAPEAERMSGYPRIHRQNAETIMAFEVEYMTVSLLTTIDFEFSLLTPPTRPYMTNWGIILQEALIINAKYLLFTSR